MLTLTVSGCASATAGTGPASSGGPGSRAASGSPGGAGRSHLTPAYDPAASNRERTVAAVERAMAFVRRLPGAKPTSSLPVLAGPSSTMASQNFVDRHRLFTAPGTLTAAMSYLRRHAGPHLKLAGSGTSTDHGRVVERDIDFTTTGQPAASTSAWAELGVDVRLVRYHGGVAERVDGQAIWRPRKPTADSIPAVVTGALVVIHRVDLKGRSRDARGRLSEAQARRVARGINRLAVTPAVVMSCPMDLGSRDVVRFTGTAQPVSVKLLVTGCGGAVITRDGKHQPELDDPYRVNAMLLKMLGLPKNFGQ